MRAAKCSELGVWAGGTGRALRQRCGRYQRATEEVNSIQYGKLLLAAKVGELAGDERGRPKKGEKKNRSATDVFHRDTLSAYRKLAKHQADSREKAFRKAYAIAFWEPF